MQQSVHIPALVVACYAGMHLLLRATLNPDYHQDSIFQL